MLSQLSMHSSTTRCASHNFSPRPLRRLGAALRLSDPAGLGKIRADLPIYLFSGSEDPVGQQLEGVKLLVERYRRAGLHHISQDFYSGGRHEMLNEINRAELLNNLLGWLAGLVEKQEGESKPGKLP